MFDIQMVRKETIGKVGKGREHSKFYVVLLDNVGQLH